MRNSVLQVGCLLVLVSFCSTPATADFVIDTFDDQPTGLAPINQ